MPEQFNRAGVQFIAQNVETYIKDLLSAGMAEVQLSKRLKNLETDINKNSGELRKNSRALQAVVKDTVDYNTELAKSTNQHKINADSVRKFASGFSREYRVAQRAYNRFFRLFKGGESRVIIKSLLRQERAARGATREYRIFRKVLSPRELEQYGDELSRLDHVLGSHARTTREFNRNVQDRTLGRANVQRFSETLERNTRDLESVQKRLPSSFDSQEANEYLQVIRLLSGEMKGASSELNTFRQNLNIPKAALNTTKEARIELSRASTLISHIQSQTRDPVGRRLVRGLQATGRAYRGVAEIEADSIETTGRAAVTTFLKVAQEFDDNQKFLERRLRESKDLYGEFFLPPDDTEFADRLDEANQQAQLLHTSGRALIQQYGSDLPGATKGALNSLIKQTRDYSGVLEEANKEYGDPKQREYADTLVTVSKALADAQFEQSRFSDNLTDTEILAFIEHLDETTEGLEDLENQARRQTGGNFFRRLFPTDATREQLAVENDLRKTRVALEQQAKELRVENANLFRVRNAKDFIGLLLKIGPLLAITGTDFGIVSQIARDLIGSIPALGLLILEHLGHGFETVVETVKEIPDAISTIREFITSLSPQIRVAIAGIFAFRKPLLRLFAPIIDAIDTTSGEIQDLAKRGFGFLRRNLGIFTRDLLNVIPFIGAATVAFSGWAPELQTAFSAFLVFHRPLFNFAKQISKRFRPLDGLFGRIGNKLRNIRDNVTARFRRDRPSAEDLGAGPRGGPGGGPSAARAAENTASRAAKSIGERTREDFQKRAARQTRQIEESVAKRTGREVQLADEEEVKQLNNEMARLRKALDKLEPSEDLSKRQFNLERLNTLTNAPGLTSDSLVKQGLDFTARVDQQLGLDLFEDSAERIQGTAKTLTDSGEALNKTFEEVANDVVPTVRGGGEALDEAATTIREAAVQAEQAGTSLEAALSGLTFTGKGGKTADAGNAVNRVISSLEQATKERRGNQLQGREVGPDNTQNLDNLRRTIEVLVRDALIAGVDFSKLDSKPLQSIFATALQSFIRNQKPETVGAARERFSGLLQQRLAKPRGGKSARTDAGADDDEIDIQARGRPDPLEVTDLTENIRSKIKPLISVSEDTAKALDDELREQIENELKEVESDEFVADLDIDFDAEAGFAEDIGKQALDDMLVELDIDLDEDQTRKQAEEAAKQANRTVRDATDNAPPIDVELPDLKADPAELDQPDIAKQIFEELTATLTAQLRDRGITDEKLRGVLRDASAEFANELDSLMAQGIADSELPAFSAQLQKSVIGALRNRQVPGAAEQAPEGGDFQENLVRDNKLLDDLNDVQVEAQKELAQIEKQRATISDKASANTTRDLNNLLETGTAINAELAKQQERLDEQTNSGVLTVQQREDELQLAQTLESVLKRQVEIRKELSNLGGEENTRRRAELRVELETIGGGLPSFDARDKLDDEIGEARNIGLVADLIQRRAEAGNIDQFFAENRGHLEATQRFMDNIRQRIGEGSEPTVQDRDRAASAREATETAEAERRRLQQEVEQSAISGADLDFSLPPTKENIEERVSSIIAILRLADQQAQDVQDKLADQVSKRATRQFEAARAEFFRLSALATEDPSVEVPDRPDEKEFRRLAAERANAEATAAQEGLLRTNKIRIAALREAEKIARDIDLTDPKDIDRLTALNDRLLSLQRTPGVTLIDAEATEQDLQRAVGILRGEADAFSGFFLPLNEHDINRAVETYRNALAKTGSQAAALRQVPEITQFEGGRIEGADKALQRLFDEFGGEAQATEGELNFIQELIQRGHIQEAAVALRNLREAFPIHELERFELELLDVDEAFAKSQKTFVDLADRGSVTEELNKQRDALRERTKVVEESTSGNLEVQKQSDAQQAYNRTNIQLEELIANLDIVARKRLFTQANLDLLARGETGIKGLNNASKALTVVQQRLAKATDLQEATDDLEKRSRALRELRGRRLEGEDIPEADLTRARVGSEQATEEADRQADLFIKSLDSVTAEVIKKYRDRLARSEGRPDTDLGGEETLRRFQQENLRTPFEAVTAGDSPLSPTYLRSALDELQKVLSTQRLMSPLENIAQLTPGARAEFRTLGEVINRVISEGIDSDDPVINELARGFGDVDTKLLKQAAQVIADYFKGASPIPLGPLSDLFEAAVEQGREYVRFLGLGLEQGAKGIVSPLEGIRNRLTGAERVRATGVERAQPEGAAGALDDELSAGGIKRSITNEFLKRIQVELPNIALSELAKTFIPQLLKAVASAIGNITFVSHILSSLPFLITGLQRVVPLILTLMNAKLVSQINSVVFKEVDGSLQQVGQREGLAVLDIFTLVGSAFREFVLNFHNLINRTIGRPEAVLESGANINILRGQLDALSMIQEGTVEAARDQLRGLANEATQELVSRGVIDTNDLNFLAETQAEIRDAAVENTRETLRDQSRNVFNALQDSGDISAADADVYVKISDEITDNFIKGQREQIESYGDQVARQIAADPSGATAAELDITQFLDVDAVSRDTLNTVARQMQVDGATLVGISADEAANEITADFTQDLGASFIGNVINTLGAELGRYLFTVVELLGEIITTRVLPKLGLKLLSNQLGTAVDKATENQVNELIPQLLTRLQAIVDLVYAALELHFFPFKIASLLVDEVRALRQRRFDQFASILRDHIVRFLDDFYAPTEQLVRGRDAEGLDTRLRQAQERLSGPAFDGRVERPQFEDLSETLDGDRLELVQGFQRTGDELATDAQTLGQTIDENISRGIIQGDQGGADELLAYYGGSSLSKKGPLSQAQRFLSLGQSIAENITQGIRTTISAGSAKIQEAISSSFRGREFRVDTQRIALIGGDIVDGIAKGISGSSSTLYSTLETIAHTLSQNFARVLIAGIIAFSGAEEALKIRDVLNIPSRSSQLSKRSYEEQAEIFIGSNYNDEDFRSIGSTEGNFQRTMLANIAEIGQLNESGRLEYVDSLYIDSIRELFFRLYRSIDTTSEQYGGRIDPLLQDIEHRYSLVYVDILRVIDRVLAGLLTSEQAVAIAEGSFQRKLTTPRQQEFLRSGIPFSDTRPELVGDDDYSFAPVVGETEFQRVRGSLDDLYEVYFDFFHAISSLDTVFREGEGSALERILRNVADPERTIGFDPAELFDGGTEAAEAYTDAFVEELGEIVPQTDEVLEELGGHLIGESPPPEGPLKALALGATESGASWRRAFVEAVGGTVGALSDTLFNIRNQLEANRPETSGIGEDIRDAFNSPLQTLAREVPILLNTLGGVAVKTLTGVGQAVAFVGGTAIDVTENLLVAFSRLLGPFSGIIETIIRFPRRFITGLVDFTRTTFNILRSAFEATRNFLRERFQQLTAFLERIGQTIIKPLILIGAAIAGAFRDVAVGVVTGIRNLAEGIANVLLNIGRGIITIADVVSRPFRRILAFIINISGRILAAILHPFAEAARFIARPIAAIARAIVAPFRGIVEFLSKIGQRIVDTILAPFRAILSILPGVGSAFKRFARDPVAEMQSSIESLGSIIQETANTLASGFTLEPEFKIIETEEELREFIVELESFDSQFSDITDSIQNNADDVDFSVFQQQLLEITDGELYDIFAEAKSPDELIDGIEKVRGLIGDVREAEKSLHDQRVKIAEENVLSPAEDIEVPESIVRSDGRSPLVEVFSDLRSVGTNIQQLGLGETFQRIFEVGEDLTEGLQRTGMALFNINMFIEQLQKTASGFGAFLARLTPGVLAFAAGIAGIAALAFQGQETIGVVQGFSQTGVDLRELREAVRGTVPDLELMETVNFALIGSSAGLRKEFGEAIPKVLTVLRDSARRTGKSLTELTGPVLEGIKKAEPELIDNAGITVRIGEANRVLAESLGITIDQLTAEQRQIALLNAVLENHDEAVMNLSNSQETAAEKIARITTTANNLIKRASFSIQPVFELILDVVDAIVTGAENIINPIIGLIRALAERIAQGVINIAAILAPVLTPVVNFIRNAFSAISGFAKDVLLGFATVIGTFTGFLVATLEAAYTRILGFVKSLASILQGGSPPPEGPLSTIDTGAFAIGQTWSDNFVRGLGSGDVEGEVESINQQLIDIAAGDVEVGSLLSGRGEELAQLIQTALDESGIAALGRDAVEKRIARLDVALKPFEQTLELVRAHIEAIADQSQKALDAIDRQIEKNLQAVLDGDAAAAALVRRLDKQAERIRERRDLNQDFVDNATIQLELARGLQAEERALLQIRLDQLGTAEQLAKQQKQAAETASEAQEAAEGGGGAASVDELEPVAVPDLPLGDGRFSGFIDEGPEKFLRELEGRFRIAQEGQRFILPGDEDFVGVGDEAENTLRAEILRGTITPEEAGLEKREGLFDENGLQRVADNLKGVGEDIADSFKEHIFDPIVEAIRQNPIVSALETHVLNPIATLAGSIFQDTFTDPKIVQQGLTGLQVIRVPKQLTGSLLGDIALYGLSFLTAIDTHLIQPILNKFREVFGDENGDISLSSIGKSISNLVKGIPELLRGAGDVVKSALGFLFPFESVSDSDLLGSDLEGLASDINSIRLATAIDDHPIVMFFNDIATAILGIFGFEGEVSLGQGIIGFIESLPDAFTNLTTVVEGIISGIAGPISNFASGLFDEIFTDEVTFKTPSLGVDDIGEVVTQRVPAKLTGTLQGDIQKFGGRILTAIQTYILDPIANTIRSIFGDEDGNISFTSIGAAIDRFFEALPGIITKGLTGVRNALKLGLASLTGVDLLTTEDLVDAPFDVSEVDFGSINDERIRNALDTGILAPFNALVDTVRRIFGADVENDPTSIGGIILGFINGLPMIGANLRQGISDSIVTPIVNLFDSIFFPVGEQALRDYGDALATVADTGGSSFGEVTVAAETVRAVEGAYSGPLGAVRRFVAQAILLLGDFQSKIDEFLLTPLGESLRAIFGDEGGDVTFESIGAAIDKFITETLPAAFADLPGTLSRIFRRLFSGDPFDSAQFEVEGILEPAGDLFTPEEFASAAGLDKVPESIDFGETVARGPFAELFNALRRGIESILPALANAIGNLLVSATTAGVDKFNELIVNSAEFRGGLASFTTTIGLHIGNALRQSLGLPTVSDEDIAIAASDASGAASGATAAASEALQIDLTRLLDAEGGVELIAYFDVVMHLELDEAGEPVVVIQPGTPLSVIQAAQEKVNAIIEEKGLDIAVATDAAVTVANISVEDIEDALTLAVQDEVVTIGTIQAELAKALGITVTKAADGTVTVDLPDNLNTASLTTLIEQAIAESILAVGAANAALAASFGITVTENADGTVTVDLPDNLNTASLAILIENAIATGILTVDAANAVLAASFGIAVTEAADGTVTIDLPDNLSQDQIKTLVDALIAANILAIDAANAALGPTFRITVTENADGTVTADLPDNLNTASLTTLIEKAVAESLLAVDAANAALAALFGITVTEAADGTVSVDLPDNLNTAGLATLIARAVAENLLAVDAANAALAASFGITVTEAADGTVTIDLPDNLNTASLTTLIEKAVATGILTVDAANAALAASFGITVTEAADGTVTIDLPDNLNTASLTTLIENAIATGILTVDAANAALAASFGITVTEAADGTVTIDLPDNLNTASLTTLIEQAVATGILTVDAANAVLAASFGITVIEAADGTVTIDLPDNLNTASLTTLIEQAVATGILTVDAANAALGPTFGITVTKAADGTVTVDLPDNLNTASLTTLMEELVAESLLAVDAANGVLAASFGITVTENEKGIVSVNLPDNLSQSNLEALLAALIAANILNVTAINAVLGPTFGITITEDADGTVSVNLPDNLSEGNLVTLVETLIEGNILDVEGVNATLAKVFGITITENADGTITIDLPDNLSEANLKALVESLTESSIVAIDAINATLAKSLGITVTEAADGAVTVDLPDNLNTASLATLIEQAVAKSLLTVDAANAALAASFGITVTEAADGAVTVDLPDNLNTASLATLIEQAVAKSLLTVDAANAALAASFGITVTEAADGTVTVDLPDNLNTASLATLIEQAIAESILTVDAANAALAASFGITVMKAADGAITVELPADLNTASLTTLIEKAIATGILTVDDVNATLASEFGIIVTEGADGTITIDLPDNLSQDQLKALVEALITENILAIDDVTLPAISVDLPVNIRPSFNVVDSDGKNVFGGVGPFGLPPTVQKTLGQHIEDFIGSILSAFDGANEVQAQGLDDAPTLELDVPVDFQVEPGSFATLQASIDNTFGENAEDNDLIPTSKPTVPIAFTYDIVDEVLDLQSSIDALLGENEDGLSILYPVTIPASLDLSTTELQTTIEALDINIPIWAGDLDTVATDHLVAPIKTALSDLNSFISNIDAEEGLASTLNAFFGGGEDDEPTENSLADFISQAVAKFAAMPDSVKNALSSFGGILWDSIGSPFVQLINYLIDGFNSFVSSIRTGGQAISAAGIGVDAPKLRGLTITKLATDKPDFLGGERGGIFGPGGLIVGERGPELIAPAQRLSVFPNAATNALAQLSEFAGRRYERPIYADRTVNNNAYNQQQYDQSRRLSVNVGSMDASSVEHLAKMRLVNSRFGR